jgi:hypothetical protein
MKQIPLLLALMLFAAPVAAKSKKVDEPPPPEQMLIDDGLAKLESGDHDGAMNSFEQSAKIANTPEVRFLIARTLYDMGLIDEAEAALTVLLGEQDVPHELEMQIKSLLFDIISSPYAEYEDALEMADEGKYLQAIERLEAFIIVAPSVPGMGLMQAKAEALLDKLKTETIGSMLIKCNAAGGKVFVDGEFAGALEEGKLSLELAAGDHHIEVSAPGHESAASTITVSGGTAKKLKVVLDEQFSGGLDSCWGFDCAHGTCVPTPAGPMCQCHPGYVQAETSTGCTIDSKRIKQFRGGSIAGITFGVLGLITLIMTPALASDWDTEVGSLFTGPFSYTFLAIGTPLAMGFRSRAVRALGDGSLGTGPTTAWAFTIAGLTISGIALPFALMQFPPMIIVAMMHATMLVGISLGAGIKTLLDTRKSNLQSARMGPMIAPFVSPIEGGAVAGLAGSF